MDWIAPFVLIVVIDLLIHAGLKLAGHRRGRDVPFDFTFGRSVGDQFTDQRIARVADALIWVSLAGVVLALGAGFSFLVIDISDLAFGLSMCVAFVLISARSQYVCWAMAFADLNAAQEADEPQPVQI